MPSRERLCDTLRDPSRPSFLFGSTPPREGTTIEKAKETCAKFAARSAVLATDGFIVYDIQEETGRTEMERPFPFRKTMDAAQYASFFTPVSGKQCIVYKSVVESGSSDFENWLDKSCNDYGHFSFNFVGAATSKVATGGLTLQQGMETAKAKFRRQGRGGFGCVCIPERHMSKGNENQNMLRKIDAGADWFVTQGIFAREPIIKLLHDYGDLCREKGITPKKVIITFAPCGRAKTMTFVKWLGMYVPEDVEKRIFESENPVKESMTFLRETLVYILEQTHNSGVPLGINVESLSIFKDEIDAAHDLFQLLQATLLNSSGSPWAVRWFRVPVSLRFQDSAKSAVSAVVTAGRKKREKEVAIDGVSTSAVISAVVAAGLVGVAVGRYARLG